ncbi:MAG: hypothetical protein IKC73_04485 [Clostridia bacterium]|nr:hypothetical protein [Clostridia bacterium]
MGSLLYTIVAILGIILFLMPVGKIGNVSIGSGLRVLIDSIKLFFEKTEGLSASSQELRGFLLPLFAFLILFILNSLMGAIITPLATAPETCNAGFPQWLFSLGKTILGIVYLIYIKWLSEYYALSAVTLYAFPLCIIPSVAIRISDLLYFKKHSLESEEGDLYRIDSLPVKQWIGHAVEYLLVPIILMAALFVPVKYNVLTRYSTLPTARVGATELSPFVGEWKTSITISNDQGLDISVSPNNTAPWTEIGTNYRYYTAKISDLKQEMNKLFPEENSKEGLEKYAKQWEELNQNIQDLEKALDHLPTNKTTVTSDRDDTIFLETVRITSITYDANTSFHNADGHKWGYDGVTLGNTLFCSESIVIDTTLTTETDFTAALIKAIVTYRDGSYKISLIRPENALELNNASAGTHTLLFSDEWGEYEATIQIMAPRP